MDSLKKHGDPLDDEVRNTPVRAFDEVGDNQPGSKGDGSTDRPGSGARDASDTTEGEFVRSASQKPNPSQPDHDATRSPDGVEPGHGSNF